MSGFSFWLKLRGLPYNSGPTDICRFLKDVRLEGGVDGVYFGVNNNGKPSGEAFVEVLTEGEVEKALIHHKAMIGSRYIEVYASSEDEMWRKTDKNRAPGHFVRLRGLPFGCLKEDIKTFFQGSYIRPRGITLLLDRQERCNGGAYVEFATKKGCDSAVKRHRCMMGERYVEVFPSSEQELDQMIEKSSDGAKGFSIMVSKGGTAGVPGSGGPGMARNSPGGGRYGGGIGGGRGGARGGQGGPLGGMRDREGREPNFSGRGRERGHGMPPAMEPIRIPFPDDRRRFGGLDDFRGGPRPMPEDFQQPIPLREPERIMQAAVVAPSTSASAPEHRVHVRGMPPSGNAADLTKLFYPIAVMNVLLINDARNRPTGEADVFFNSHAEAIKALDVNRNMGNYRLDFYLHSEPGPADRLRQTATATQVLNTLGQTLAARQYDDLAVGRGQSSLHQTLTNSASASLEALQTRYSDVDRSRSGGSGYGTSAAGQYSSSGGSYGGGDQVPRSSFRGDSGRMGGDGGYGGGYGGGRRY